MLIHHRLMLVAPVRGPAPVRNRSPEAFLSGLFSEGEPILIESALPWGKTLLLVKVSTGSLTATSFELLFLLFELGFLLRS